MARHRHPIPSDQQPLMMLPDSAIRNAALAARVKRRGHAGQPGTGPDGETCRTCRFYTLRHFSSVYRKCGHPAAPKWTGGAATDIRARDPACLKWEPDQT